jgi:hypothetical protein
MNSGSFMGMYLKRRRGKKTKKMPRDFVQMYEGSIIHWKQQE